MDWFEEEKAKIIESNLKIDMSAEIIGKVKSYDRPLSMGRDRRSNVEGLGDRADGSRLIQTRTREQFGLGEFPGKEEVNKSSSQSARESVIGGNNGLDSMASKS